MNRLIKAELYKTKKTFYKRFLLAYFIFYLAYPVFFWFFGRFHAEEAFRSAKGIDFFISMPHYLEYAWIWLPILASRFFTEDNTYLSFHKLIGYKRSRVFLSKVLSWYILCSPFLVIRIFTFPLAWAFIYRRGSGIGIGSSNAIMYIRYFGNVTDSMAPVYPQLIEKTMIFHVLSFLLMAAIVFACAIFTEDKIVAVVMSIVLSFIPREGIGMIVKPSENSRNTLSKLYYSLLTKNIYELEWSKISLLVLITIMVFGAAYFALNAVFSNRDMN